MGIIHFKGFYCESRKKIEGSFGVSVSAFNAIISSDRARRETHPKTTPYPPTYP